MNEEAYNKLLAKREQIVASTKLRNNPVVEGSKRGGRRAGAGGKPRVSREWIVEKLAPDYPFVYAKLLECIDNCDTNAIKLYLSYFLGLPPNKLEVTGAEGGPMKIVWEEHRSYNSIDIVTPEFIEGETEDDQKLIGE